MRRVCAPTNDKPIVEIVVALLCLFALDAISSLLVESLFSQLVKLGLSRQELAQNENGICLVNSDETCRQEKPIEIVIVIESKAKIVIVVDHWAHIKCI